MFKNVYLGLGSNLGNKMSNITNACKKLKECGIKITNASSLYQSSAVTVCKKDPSKGTTDNNDPDFFNAVIEVSCGQNPNQLLKIIHNIESELGRVRGEKWIARTIDIDILIFDDKIVNDAHLKIPHPEIKNRPFVYIPLIEISEINGRSQILQREESAQEAGNNNLKIILKKSELMKII